MRLIFTTVAVQTETVVIGMIGGGLSLQSFAVRLGQGNEDCSIEDNRSPPRDNHSGQYGQERAPY